MLNEPTSLSLTVSLSIDFFPGVVFTSMGFVSSVQIDVSPFYPAVISEYYAPPPPPQAPDYIRWVRTFDELHAAMEDNRLNEIVVEVSESGNERKRSYVVLN
jgi:hypothetical protein